MRKDAGLELTDRIALTLPAADADLLDARRPDQARDARRRRSASTARACRAIAKADRARGRRLSGCALGEARARAAARPAAGRRRPRRPPTGGSVDAAGAEPVADAGHELLRRGRARGDADRLDAVEPALVDLRLVVDQVRGDAGGARDVDEPVRVRAVPRADHEQQVDLREQLLHRLLAVRGRVADVLLLRRVDLREAPAQDVDDLASSRRPRASSGSRRRPSRRPGGRAPRPPRRSTRTIASGASPIVPTTSSWPAWPMRTTV